MLRGVAALLLAALWGCAPAPPVRQAFVFEGPTMGTAYQVKVVREALDDERREALDAAIRRELDGVNGAMSTYRDDSELSRFNRHAETTPFPISEETWEVFRVALEVSRLSDGAFDVTVGPLVNAWGFGPGQTTAEGESRPLSEEELLALRERIGWRKLDLVEEPRAVAKSQPDLYCDLSAIAKGYAVDRVAEALLAMGESDFMVEVGGEVRAAGSNAEGRSWRIGIERPQVQRGSVQRVVPVSGQAIATSGDYRNYREVGSVRVSHIMDPRSGWPVHHRLASVSVVHESCTMADALATTLMVLGEDEGFELAQREGWAVDFLVRDGDGFRELRSPAFEELLKSQENQ